MPIRCHRRSQHSTHRAFFEKPRKMNIRNHALNGISTVRQQRMCAGVWGGVVKRTYLFILMVCIVSTVPASADPFRFGAQGNRLGNADSFGYVRIVRTLGEYPLTDGRAFPMHLVFSSNPKREPGAFGPYWHMPLFDSTVVQFDQYKLYWDGPDELRHFFDLDRSADARRSEKVFVQRGQKWRATIDRRGDILIEAIERPNWYYRYRDGRLEEFRLGEGSSAYRIAYSNRGYPLYITDASTNRRVFEVTYRGGTDPERVTIGDQRVHVEMGDGDLTAPDGQTSYRNFRVRFLRSLQVEGEAAEQFEYSKGAAHPRTIPEHVNAEGTKIAEKLFRIATNRMVVRTGTEGASENFVQWEAQSGFILADSGASYAISNESWDPLNPRADNRVAPRSVRIERQPAEGQPQLWAYDWKSGVRTYTDLATGDLMRRTYIMSGGNAHLKLRKRERKSDSGWDTLDQRAYDPAGRIIRRIAGPNLVTINYDGRGSVSQWALGGVLVREIVNADGLKVRDVKYRNGLPYVVIDYDEQGLRSKVSTENGNTREYVRKNEGAVVEVYINEVLREKRFYNEISNYQKRMIYDETGIPATVINYEYPSNGQRVVRRVSNISKGFQE